jgi:dTDP-4-dehydrorhamnose reductase
VIACAGDDREAMQRLFDKHQFAAVLNCEGTCKLKSCEMDPAMARRINIDSVATLLDVIGGTSTRLIHLSIDLVFSGTRGGGHIETDETDPVTVYGKTMAEAERMILPGVWHNRSSQVDFSEQEATEETEDTKSDMPSRNPSQVVCRSPLSPLPPVHNKPHCSSGTSAAILRISLPMGVSFNGHAGAIDWIQHRFKKGNPATLYFDEVRTPTYTDCLSPLVADVLARRDITGLFHAGGPRRLTLFEIAQVVNRVGRYDPELLHGCLRADAGPMPPRAGDVTMNSSKLAAALGYQPFDPWPLDDEHVPTHREWHFEGERGSPALLKELLYHNPRRRRVASGAAALDHA